MRISIVTPSKHIGNWIKALHYDITKGGDPMSKEVDNMGMSDEQFEVYNALITFIDELIDREPDEKEKQVLKTRKKNILANNKEIQ